MVSATMKRRRNTITRLMDTKTISFFSGICLLVNAMTGPSMPFTASLFQQGGLIIPILLFVFFAVLSTLACLFIVEAMRLIPGNKNFQGVVEFATLVNFYFSDRPFIHLFAQLCLYGAIQSNAIQSIVLSAQTLDNVLIDIFGKTCGLAVPPFHSIWHCVSETSSTSSPFGDTVMFFTIGYLLVLVFVIPMAIFDLEDNMYAQVVAFVVSGIIIIQWLVASFLYILVAPENPHRGNIQPTVRLVGSELDNLAGTIMLSLAYTFVVPSWINIKRCDVNVQKTLWASSMITCAMYLFIGIIPTLAFPLNEAAGGNILPTLAQLGIPHSLTKITCHSFSLVMLLPSIPVSCIVSKNNLVQNGVCSNFFSILLTFVLPWIISIPFLTGSSLGVFLNWSSLLFVSTANFIIPVFIYLAAVKFRRMYDLDRGVLSEKQRRLLKLIHETSKSISRWMDYCSMYSKPGEDAIVTITRKRDSFGSSICSSNNISIADEKFYSVKSTKDIIADDDDDIVYFESVQDQLPSPLLPAITITASTLPNSSPMYLEPPRPIISLNGYRSSSNISNDEATSARVSYSHLDPGAFKRLSLPSHPDFSMMHPFKTAPSWVLSFIPINVLAWGCIIIQVLLTLLSIALAIFETLSG